MNRTCSSTIQDCNPPPARLYPLLYSYFSQAKDVALITVFTLFFIAFTSFFLLWVSLAHGAGSDQNLQVETARLAQQGDAQAQFSLALMYEEGGILPHNVQKNVYWLTKAAQQNLPAACIYLGIKFQFGNGVRKNLDTAAKLYEKAAVQGWAMAQYLLAELLLDEKPTANRLIAGAWLKIAGEQAYPQAEEKYQYIMGTLTEQEKRQLRAYYEQFGKRIKKNSF